MVADRSRTALGDIADALGVSADVFLGQESQPDVNGTVEELQQVAELLDVFTRITDPKVRRECILYVKSRLG